MEFGHLEGVPQPQVLGTYILYNQVMGWSSKYMGVQKKLPFTTRHLPVVAQGGHEQLEGTP